MHISELKNSNFLKKEDVGRGAKVTIRDVVQKNMAKDGEKPDMRWCIVFDEFDKPMVLNSVNGQLIAQITGADESDGWIGKQVVIYNDPSVSFGGKVTGGIRVRAPRIPLNQQPAKQDGISLAPAPAKEQIVSKVKNPDIAEIEEDDDLPF